MKASSAAGEKPVAYTYSKQHLSSRRPVRVIVIGAGISGIAAVHIFREKFANQPVELAIYEKNNDVGGTWLENRYPGCACDVPAHMYTYTWEGNPFWSKAYVGSDELFAYFKGRAVAYGADEFVRLEHQVTEATWLDDVGKWRVHVKNLRSDESFYDEAEVLINAAGFLKHVKWKWPQVPGLQSFEGQLMHSAHWDDSYDFNGKAVAVIGSGSSAIQIVPQLQPKVKHLTSFNRSRTWITPEFAEEFAPDGRATRFSEEQQQKWAKDPAAFLEYRKQVDTSMNVGFEWAYKDSEAQRQFFQKSQTIMKNRLSGKKGLADELIPHFAVGCRRISPGHRYLETLTLDNVSVRTDAIDEVSAKGITMSDGTFIAVDAIICATGFDTSYRPSFPLLGKDSEDLRLKWATEPRSYLSIAAAGYPNYFIVAGPNFPIANGSLIPSIEAALKYAFRAVDKIQKEGIRSLSVTKAAVDDFQEHKDSVMKDMVWTSGCNSWYKDSNGRVWGPWCGSSLHFLELMSESRWEDWDIEYISRNRFQYLGNGMTRREETKSNLAYYLTQASLE